MPARQPDLYRLDPAWLFRELIKLAGVLMVVGLLFFDSVIFSLAGLPLCVIMYKNDWRKRYRVVQDGLRAEFVELIENISSNLSAGYSLENAFVRSSRELLSGSDIALGPCLEIMNNGISCNENIEELFGWLARVCRLDDVYELADMIGAAKLYGGDMVRLIKNYVRMTKDKLLLEREIETMFQSKRMEGIIMLLAPFEIIIYMKLTNGGYIDYLYEHIDGRIVMGLCLFAVAMAFYMVNRFTRIEV